MIMVDYSHIKIQLEEVLLRISQSAQKAGINPDEVKLVAVSKTFPVEAIIEAFNAGQRIFGENRVQEMASKFDRIPSDVEWHLIGHLQSNKTAGAVKMAKVIHAVDSEDLISRINRISGDLRKKQEILLEINI